MKSNDSKEKLLECLKVKTKSRRKSIFSMISSNEIESPKFSIGEIKLASKNLSPQPLSERESLHPKDSKIKGNRRGSEPIKTQSSKKACSNSRPSSSLRADSRDWSTPTSKPPSCTRACSPPAESRPCRRETTCARWPNTTRLGADARSTSRSSLRWFL